MTQSVPNKNTYPPLDIEQAKALGLPADDWTKAADDMGRPPNELEVRILARIWDEEVSRKSSRRFLQTLPRTGEHVVNSGNLRVGMVEIGEGLSLAVRVESNNRMAHLEPWSGAAFAASSSLEQVRAVGAEPLAFAAALRIGSPEVTENYLLVRRMVESLGRFANVSGVPLSAEDLFFHSRFDGGSMVTSCAVGLVRTPLHPRKPETGSPLLYIGLPTGPDGLKSSDGLTGSAATSLRLKYPEAFYSQQLGAALEEAMQRKLLNDVVDVTSGGLAYAAFELSRRLGMGVRFDSSRIPVRGGLNHSRSVLLSESGCRLLGVTSKGTHRELGEIFQAWGIDLIVVGEVLEGDGVEFQWQHHLVGSIPTKLPLGEGVERTFELLKYPPMLRKKHVGDDESSKRPRLARDKDVTEWDLIRKQAPIPTAAESSGPLPAPENLPDLWVDMLADPNLCSRRLFFQRFDQEIGARAIRPGECPAALLRIGDSERGLALSSSGWSLYMEGDPYLGAVHGVATTLRRLASVGARPVCVAGALHFGDPDKHRDISAFSEAARGFGDTCRHWEIPIISDVVTFHNGTDVTPTLPTPQIFMLGVVENLSQVPGIAFRRVGDRVFLLGETRDEVGCSEYASYYHDRLGGSVPDIDFDRERRGTELIRELVASGHLCSAHTLSLGGLAIALTEACLMREKAIGATVLMHDTEQKMRADTLLFSETSGRYLISFRESDEAFIRSKCAEANLPITGEGLVGGKAMKLEGALTCEVPIATARRIWSAGFDHLLGGDIE